MDDGAVQLLIILGAELLAIGLHRVETVEEIGSYILTNYRRDAVSLKQYNDGKNA